MKKKSLNKKLMAIIALCGIVPVTLVVLFVTNSYRHGIVEKMRIMIEAEMQYTAALVSGRLDSAMEEFQMKIHEVDYADNWMAYQNGQLETETYIRNCEHIMEHMLNETEKFDTFLFYQAERETVLSYVSDDEQFELADVGEIVDELTKAAEKCTQNVQLLTTDGKVYLMKNLFSADGKEKYGAIAAELNYGVLFRHVHPKWAERMELYLNRPDNLIVQMGEKKSGAQEKIHATLMEKLQKKETFSYIARRAGYSGYVIRQYHDSYNIGIVYVAKNKQLYMEVYDFYLVVFVVVLVMAGVIAYVIRFLKKQITEPFERMLAATKKMEQGEIGTQVPGGAMPNEEFSRMQSAFDKMSRQIKYLFEYARDKELAEKDAKIMMLQSQINPHFLNNTLETMNWQARIAGDMEVSAMIESLGTVLDYTMNRETKCLIPLSEELKCVEAYFYIITKRFGSRLTIAKDVEEQLLNMEVPQLILQPLVENAVEHGWKREKKGEIRLHIYQEGTDACLKVCNSGKALTEEEQEKIRILLNLDTDEALHTFGNHSSLAVRNINERLKLLYGGKAGLTIQQEGMYVVSTIKIPIGKQKEEGV